MKSWIASTSAVRKNTSVNIQAELFVCTVFISLILQYPWVEWVCYLISQCLTLGRTTKLFFVMAIPFYNPTMNIWEIHFFHTLLNICYYPFFLLAILVIVKWYVIVVFCWLFEVGFTSSMGAQPGAWIHNPMIKTWVQIKSCPTLNQLNYPDAPTVVLVCIFSNE